MTSMNLFCTFRFRIRELSIVASFAGDNMSWQEHDGDGAFKLGVLGFIDNAHAAFAELFENFVM